MRSLILALLLLPLALYSQSNHRTNFSLMVSPGFSNLFATTIYYDHHSQSNEVTSKSTDLYTGIRLGVDMEILQQINRFGIGAGFGYQSLRLGYTYNYYAINQQDALNMLRFFGQLEVSCMRREATETKNELSLGINLKMGGYQFLSNADVNSTYRSLFFQPTFVIDYQLVGNLHLVASQSLELMRIWSKHRQEDQKEKITGINFLVAIGVRYVLRNSGEKLLPTN